MNKSTPEQKAVKTNKPYFFTVSTFKLITMSFFTLGFYQFYWAYKNWHLIKARTGQTVWSFWQVIFFPFTAYLYFKQIKTTALDHKLTSRLPIGLLAIAYFIIWMLRWLHVDFGFGVEFNIFFFFIISFALAGLLIPINNLALRVNKQFLSDFSNNKRFLIGNGVGILLGTGFFLFLVWGMLLNKVDHFMLMGIDYEKQGKHGQALESFFNALAISKKIDWTEKSRLSTATTYITIGGIYSRQGNFLKAEYYYQQALAYSEKKWGETSLNTVIAYNAMGSFYRTQNNYTQAISYYKKTLKVRENILGKEHLSTAESYSAIGHDYMFQNHYKKAEKAYRQALAIREKTGGKAHIDTAISYNEMGSLYKEKGNYSQALSFHQKALAIHEQLLGENNTKQALHKLIADTYQKIGSIYQTQRDDSQALVFYQKALASYNSVNNHLNAAMTYLMMHLVYYAQEDYANALLFCKKAMVLAEQKIDRPELTAKTYDLMASVYAELKDDSMALLYNQKASVILENTFSKDDPRTAENYKDMGDRSMTQRDYPQALRYYEKALAIYEKSFGKTSVKVSFIYLALKHFYEVQGNYQQALKYDEKVLAIYEVVFGKEHSQTALAYLGLGGSYVDLGNTKKALFFYEKALAIYEKVFGKEHLTTAEAYRSIGVAYASIADYQKALHYSKTVLTTHEKVLGKTHRKTIHSYLEVGLFFHFNYQDEEAYHYAKQGLDLFLKQREHHFSSLNPQQKQNYLEDNRVVIRFFTVAVAYIFHLDDQGKDKEEEQLKQTTFNDWLAFKGSVLESENRLIRFAQTSQNPKVQQHYQQLIQLKQTYAKLAQETPEEPKKRFAQKIRLENQAKKIDQLRNNITEKDPRFKQAMRSENVTGKALADKLSPDMLYLDYGKINDNYILFTLSDNNLTVGTFGAKSQKIDDELATFRKQIEVIEKGVVPNPKHIKYASQQVLGRLHALVLDIPENMADKKQLIISPDANLRLLPFEALYDTKAKQYIIEQKSIQYIANGRELLRSLQHKSKQSSNKTQRAVVFSNPNFNQENPTIPQVPINLAVTKQLRAFSQSANNLSLQFGSVDELPGTAKEAIKIQKAFSNNNMPIQSWEQEQASEANLLKTKQANILHIATHGYFNANNPNPMLQSGILLAGANHSIKNHSDTGIVSALKLSGLNLNGTDLVVLSACNTGVVDPKATEGVSGLTKAFMQAGAQKVMMSLWEVADNETADLMSDFYKTSQGKASRYIPALRQSKRAMIKKGLHPYYWSAFVLHGS